MSNPRSGAKYHRENRNGSDYGAMITGWRRVKREGRFIIQKLKANELDEDSLKRMNAKRKEWKKPLIESLESFSNSGKQRMLWYYELSDESGHFTKGFAFYYTESGKLRIPRFNLVANPNANRRDGGEGYFGPSKSKRQIAAERSRNNKKRR